MPTYPYECEGCRKTWDVVKSVSAIDNPEPCEVCGKPALRRIALTNFTGASDWNNQTYNPALGCYTKSNKEAQQIAKRRGMIELGTEKVETVHKHFENQREDTRKQRWKDAEKVKVYE